MCYKSYFYSHTHTQAHVWWESLVSFNVRAAYLFLRVYTHSKENKPQSQPQQTINGRKRIRKEKEVSYFFNCASYASDLCVSLEILFSLFAFLAKNKKIKCIWRQSEMRVRHLNVFKETDSHTQSHTRTNE